VSLIARSIRSERLRAIAARVLLDAGLVLGGALAFAAVALAVGHDGGLAYDTQAYWLAGRHALDGTPLYTRADYSTLAIYTYPPIFAQMFAPASLLPELAVAWLWRVSCVLCLRYLVGSWRAAIVACVFVPVLTELSIGNVTLQIAAILIFALRDRRGAYLLPWIAALKFGPALLVPYLWFRRPDCRRPLVVGSLVFGVACLASYALAPSSWSGYFDMLGWQNGAQLEGSQVLHLVTGSGGLDFVLRFGLAAAVVVYATCTRRAWLAYAAASITCPVLAFSRFASLVGLWRFRRAAEDESDAATTAVPDGAAV
jgi:Glycosyltransferase family 87